MKLLHLNCGTIVTILTTKLLVKVLEVTTTEDNTLEPVLLDIMSDRTGKIRCSCPKCKQEEVPFDELGLTCIKCGNPVPIFAVYHLGHEWPVLCEKDAKVLYAKAFPNGVVPPIEPAKLKFK